MEFALSEDQVMLQSSVTGVLERSAPLDTIRAIAREEEDGGALDRALSELGLAQLAAPETVGGLGLGLLDAALVQEALGASVAPSRFLSTVIALAALGDSETDIAAHIASGDMRIAMAVSDVPGARADAGVTATGGQLRGKALFVFDAEGASHILVADREFRVYLVAANAAGLSVHPMPTIDRTRRFSHLVFDGVSAQLLKGASAMRAIEAGRLLLAADTLGACQSMLDKAVAYAKERKQFNRVIGSFQAVKHMCAEMAAQLEPSRALVWHAAHAVDQQFDDASVMVLLAKSHLADVGTFVARTSTEVHGGMGFTDLVGLHYWFKRIGVNRQLLGGPERVRAEAARMQGWV
ncbi:MAG: acyl-CoA dehydrogenase [Pseudomonadota bacterium]